MRNFLQKGEICASQNNGFFDKITIKNRVTLLIIFSLLFLFVFSTSFFVWSFSKSMYEQKAQQIEYITELATGYIQTYADDVKSGKLTLEEAQKRAKERLKGMRYDNGNYIWVNDYDGIMLVHAEKPEMEGKSLLKVQDLKGKYVFVDAIKLAKEKGNALMEYYWAKPGFDKNKAFRKYSYVRGFNEWNWLVASGVYIDDIEAKINDMIIKSLGLNIFVIILAIIIGNLTIGKSIVKPIENLTHLSLELADNNLAVKIPEDTNKTEIGDLNRSFKKFVENFGSLIKQVISSTDDISASSEEMNASSEQTAQGAQQTATSTSQLAQGTQEMANNINLSLENINKITHAIQQIAQNANDGADATEEAKKSSVQGSKKAKMAADKMIEIKTATGDIAKDIGDLKELSEKIGEITELIKGIAGQTNLLALNAAIEAARAGEHGKGFAVVADEVKKLAGQSAEATEKITTMIKEIQQKVGQSVSTTEGAVIKIQEGVKIAEETGDILSQLNHVSENVNLNALNIAKDAQILTENADNMSKMIENISSITEETAASAEEISSITEEQTASLEEISASSQTLASIAEKLTSQVSVFKI